MNRFDGFAVGTLNDEKSERVEPLDNFALQILLRIHELRAAMIFAREFHAGHEVGQCDRISQLAPGQTTFRRFGQIMPHEVFSQIANGLHSRQMRRNGVRLTTIDVTHDRPRLTLQEVAKELLRMNPDRFGLELFLEVTSAEAKFGDGFTLNGCDS